MRQFGITAIAATIALYCTACAHHHSQQWFFAHHHDADDDGVMDRYDHCPQTPRGVKVDYVGCSGDADGDGVPDGLDRCPRTAEGARVDYVGCALDTDCDGVDDALDACPGTPLGVEVDRQGCRRGNDADGDGVLDEADLCPETLRGEAVDATGCGRVTRFEIEGVHFETDQSALSDVAQGILDRVQALMEASPERQLRISGHTDSVGDEAYNLGLSQRRADSVADYLEQMGVARERMTIEAFGETRPAADNETPEGRARNRRVEIEVVAEDSLGTPAPSS